MGVVVTVDVALVVGVDVDVVVAVVVTVVVPVVVADVVAVVVTVVVGVVISHKEAKSPPLWNRSNASLSRATAAVHSASDALMRNPSIVVDSVVLTELPGNAASATA